MRRQCVHERDDGSRCRAWAMRDRDTCYRHSMSDEGWREHSRAANRARQLKAREQDLRRDLDDYQEGRRVLQNFLEITSAWLDAKTGYGDEPDFERVSAALIALGTAFRLGTREELLGLLEEVRGPRLAHEMKTSSFLPAHLALR